MDDATPRRAEIDHKVLQLICEASGFPPDDLELSFRLKEELELDSLDVVELVMQIENEFKFDAPDDNVLDVVTIQDVLDLAQELVPSV